MCHVAGAERPSASGWPGCASGLFESAQFPGRRQIRRRVVPQQGTLFCHRAVQFGLKHRGASLRRWSCRSSRSNGAGNGRSSPRHDGTDLGFFWIPIYRRPGGTSPRFQGGTGVHHQRPIRIAHANKVGLKLFPHRQTWAFSRAKFLTDPIWWFWLFWASPFFHDKFNVDLKHIGLPLIIIYNLASVRQHRRWMDSNRICPAGLEHQPVPQNGIADLCHLRPSVR